MRMRFGTLIIFVFVAAVLAGQAPAAPSAAQAAASAQTPPGFKVAFIGDQDVGGSARAVLSLIDAEGADMVLHQGDLGYGDESDPQRAIDWDAQITDILGADFPYFASVGNHDTGNWPTYRQLLLDRLALVPGANCSGDYGVAAACSYQGLFFILSGAGTMGSDHAAYIRAQLAQDDSIWRVCTWHKNQNAMQVGSKPDEVGWEPYEECRLGGAIIATAHEHSYSRTKTLSDTQSQTVDPLWPEPGMLRVGDGSTFVFVSGLGGKDIRGQERCLPTAPPYGCNGEWASIYTSDQAADYGALFIEFNVDGDPGKASGYFKNIAGVTVDSFTVVASRDLAVGGIAERLEVAGTEGEARQPSGRPVPAAGIGLALLGSGAALALAAWRRGDRDRAHES